MVRIDEAEAAEVGEEAAEEAAEAAEVAAEEAVLGTSKLYPITSSYLAMEVPYRGTQSTTIQ